MPTSEPSAVELLRPLIAHNTVNPGGDEVALCKHLAPMLSALGADRVEIGEVERKGTTGGFVFASFGTPEVLVNVHIDTVPVNRGWSRDPFTVEVSDGKLYGLGSADTKGAIACLLAAAETQAPKNIAFLFSGDEENGSTVVPEVIRRGFLAGIRHALVCEPTGRVAGIRHRGYLAYRADFEGHGGHSSKADSMPKPVATLARVAVGLDELAIARTQDGPDDMKGLCLNVASLEGGVAFNVVPQSATLSWSARHWPGFALDEFEAQQDAIISRVSEKIVRTRVLNQAPFDATQPEFFRELLHGSVSDFVPLDFWTEAAVFAEAGINAVVVGPGYIGQAHAADEFVSLDDLAWATEMFQTVLGRVSE